MKLRTLALAILTAAATIFVAACGEDNAEKAEETAKLANTPKEVILAMEDAMIKGDMDTALKYISKDCKFRKELLNASDEDKKKAAESLKKEQPLRTWGKEEINGDEAIVHYTMTRRGVTSPRIYILKKEDGQWKYVDDKFNP